jgi:CRP-like cAMP-binding protein
MPIKAHTQQATEQVLKAGTVLFRRSEFPSNAVRLLEGTVVLGWMEGDAMQQHLGLVQGPCWLDIPPLILGSHHTLDAQAQSEVRICHWPLPWVRAQLQDLPPTASEFLSDLAKVQLQQAELAGSRLVLGADARLAQWLLKHAEPVETGASETASSWRVVLSDKKRQIAAQLGISPETFSRMLRQFREQCLISGSGRHLCLVNLAGLQDLARVLPY